MKLHQKLIEARHLMRKHALVTMKEGDRYAVQCMECGRNGAEYPQDVEHKADCRYAILMAAFGETVKIGGEVPTTNRQGEHTSPAPATDAPSSGAHAYVMQTEECLS